MPKWANSLQGKSWKSAYRPAQPRGRRSQEGGGLGAQRPSYTYKHIYYTPTLNEKEPCIIRGRRSHEGVWGDARSVRAISMSAEHCYQ